MKFKLISKDGVDLTHVLALPFAELNEHDDIVIDVNIWDIAQLSHVLGFGIALGFDDKNGYKAVVVDATLDPQDV